MLTFQAPWRRASALRDPVYASSELRPSPGAGPLWARLAEIGTNRPIFSNRDGVLLHDFDKLTDRRRGYAWFTVQPAATLAEYERWAKAHPRRVNGMNHGSSQIVTDSVVCSQRNGVCDNPRRPAAATNSTLPRHP